jgi:hypothetical protein
MTLLTRWGERIGAQWGIGKARKYGLRGIDAALDGITGTTAIHICFGYAAIIHFRARPEMPQKKIHVGLHRL